MFAALPSAEDDTISVNDFPYQPAIISSLLARATRGEQPITLLNAVLKALSDS
jgi:hypothetical protein